MYYDYDDDCADACEKGMGSAVSSNAVNQSSKIQELNKKDLSEKVASSYYKYEKINWKGNYEGQTSGTKAGGKWNNNPPDLPEFDSNGNKITYREFDVNNKLEDALRDSERFIRGSDESVYYTPDHYVTFFKII